MKKIIIFTIKSFFIYTPIVIFWLMMFHVNFDGSLFMNEFQKITKENIQETYLKITIILDSLFISIITIQGLYLKEKSLKTIIQPL